MTQRGYDMLCKRKFAGSDSRMMKRLAQPLSVSMDSYLETSNALTKNAFRRDNVFVKGPIGDTEVIERCLFRQRVFDQVWADSAVRGPIAVPWVVAANEKRKFYQVREYTEPDAVSFGAWIGKKKSHRVLLDEKLCETAMDAFLHIFRRYIIGIGDRGGTATLSHVLVAPDDRSLVAISISDDGRRERKIIDHTSQHHSVLSLLNGARWNLEARKTLKIVCGGINRLTIKHRLKRMNERSQWNEIYDLVAQHQLQAQVDVLEMQKRFYALYSAVSRGRIVD